MGHVASASTTTAQIISPPPPNTHVTSAISPQESIQEEPEPEVIGAGLPLMQRLRMLKAKEDRQARDAQSKVNHGRSTEGSLDTGGRWSVLGRGVVCLSLSRNVFDNSDGCSGSAGTEVRITLRVSICVTER